MRIHRRWTTVARFAAVVLLAASCGSEGSEGAEDSSAGEPDGQAATSAAEPTEDTQAASPAEASPTELQEIVFAANLRNAPSFAAEYLADAGGYFAEEGLEVNIEEASGPQSIQQLLAGNSIVSREDGIAIMDAIANQGAELVIIGTRAPMTFSRFASSADNPFEEPADLAGMTVGLPSRGGVSELTLELLMHLGDVDPESVQLEIAPLTPAAFDLVEAGRLDVTSATFTGSTVIAANYPNAVILDAGEFLNAGGAHYVTTRSALDEHRDALERFLRAIHAASAAIVADEALSNTLEEILTEYGHIESLRNTEQTKTELSQYVEAWTMDRGNSLEIDMQRWVEGYQELVDVGAVPGGLDPEQWATNELVPTGG